MSRRDPVGDLVTTVAPMIGVLFDQRATRVAVRYQVSGEWHRQRKEANRLSSQGDMDAAISVLDRAIPGLRVSLGGSYSHAGSLPTTLLGGGPQTPVDAVRLPLTETTQWGGRVTADYPVTPRLNGRLGYSYAVTRYEPFDFARVGDIVASTPALTLRTYNSTVHDATMELRYRYSPVTTLVVNSGRSTTRTDPVQTTPPAVTDTRVTVRGTAGVEYLAGPLLTLGGRVGATVIEDDQTHLTLDADVARTLKSGRLTLAVRQGVGTGGGVTRTVSLTQGVTAEIITAVSAQTTANLRLNYDRRKSIPTLTLDPIIRISTYEVSGGISRQLLRRVAAHLAYSYLTQQSQGIALDAQRHLVTLTLTAHMPEWRVFR